MQNQARKFNPGLHQDDASLIAQYVVRLPLLKILLEIIDDNSQQQICQHCLYYAPRGRGKTMLIARVAAEIRTNPTFSKHWLALRLFEESYYEISNLGEFWLEVLSEMALSTPPPLQKSAQRVLAQLKEKWSHPDLAQMAQAAVIGLLRDSDKKAIIMVENMHQLVAETDEDFAWTIRKIMQNEPRIMFLATATTRFEQLDNAKSAFFEIFATTELTRLKRREVALLWNNLTESNKTKMEVAPIDILTGGSPRLLNIMAQFSKKSSIRALMENLAGLVDEYTEYFRSQLEALAPKERRVFLALADLWASSTAKAIAQRARMDIRSTSALLGRLAYRGAIKVDASNPRKKIYVVAERLFCIYYKLRRVRNQNAVIESLVQFMVDFYTPSELKKIQEQYLQQTKLHEVERIFLAQLSSVNNHVDEKAGDLGASQDDDIEILIQEAITLFNQSVTYGQQGDIDKALAGYQSLITSYQDRSDIALMVIAAYALFNQSNTYRQQGDIAKGLAGYQFLVASYQDRSEIVLMEIVANALFNQSIAYGQQGDIAKELASYQSLITSYQNRSEIALMEITAKAQLNQSTTYGQQGDVDKELAGYQSLIATYQDQPESNIIEKVINATINTANLYATQQDWKNAEKNYQQALHTLKNKSINLQAILTSTSSLGQLASQYASSASPAVQQCLAKIIKKANSQSHSEERMTLATGIAALLPPEESLTLIQQSIGHEDLEPLIVALHLEKGDQVNASDEVLEVAADVRQRLLAMRTEFCSDL